jgi:hypothetical protein
MACASWQAPKTGARKKWSDIYGAGRQKIAQRLIARFAMVGLGQKVTLSAVARAKYLLQRC